MTKYHPALVALHWILAVMVIGALLMGGLVMSEMPNDNPDKIAGLRAHMIVGITILVLMLVRVVVRLRTGAPAPVDSGNPLLNLAARVTHPALYVLAIAMAGSGVVLSLQSGLPGIVFGGQGSLPESFEVYSAREVHGTIAGLLGALAALHVAAAFWHRIVRKDGVMARMSFGGRK